MYYNFITKSIWNFSNDSDTLVSLSINTLHCVYVYNINKVTFTKPIKFQARHIKKKSLNFYGNCTIHNRKIGLRFSIVKG